MMWLARLHLRRKPEVHHARAQVDNNDQLSNQQRCNSVMDGQPPFKEGAGSAQCQHLQVQPQDNDNDKSSNSVSDRQPPLKEGASSAQCQGIQVLSEVNNNTQKIQVFKLKTHVRLNPGSPQQSSDPGKIVVLDSCPEFGKKKPEGVKKLSESEAKMKELITDHRIDQVICTDGSVKHKKEFAGYGHLAWDVKKREFHSETQNTVLYYPEITSMDMESQAVISATESMINYTKENPAARTYLVLSDSKDMINNLKNESNELRKELESQLQETHIKIFFVYCSENANFRISVYADHLARHVPLPKGLDIPTPDSE